jgi:hypothetical protein
LARSWIEQGGEWTTTAGWSVVASNGAMGRLTGHDVDAMLAKIQQGIHAQPNRTRHAMNNVLINIGGYEASLRPRVLAVAKSIGTVHVDHGETGCVTPDASAYIAKMVAHQAAKAAGSATKASDKLSAKHAGKTVAKSTTARPKARQVKVQRKAAKPKRVSKKAKPARKTASRKTGRKKSARSR